MSTLKATSCPLGEFFRAMKESRRRLMGSWEEPGIVTLLWRETVWDDGVQKRRAVALLIALRACVRSLAFTGGCGRLRRPRPSELVTSVGARFCGVITPSGIITKAFVASEPHQQATARPRKRRQLHICGVLITGPPTRLVGC